MQLVNVGGTQTGGSTVTLTPANSGSAQKASFVGPSHTRLAPRQVDFLVSSTTQSKGQSTARAGARITFGGTVVDNSCCTGPVTSNVIFDINGRWQMGLSEATVDEAIGYLRSVVYSPEFKAALMKGVLPV